MKRKTKKKVLALALSFMMTASLLQSGGYGVIADNTATPSDAVQEDTQQEIPALIQEETVATHKLDDIALGVSVTPTSSSSSPIDMTTMLEVSINFRLPSESVRPIASNYIYTYNLNDVTVVKNGVDTGVAALVQNADVSTPQPMYLNGNYVGTYTIKNGLVTLNFYDGIEYLQTHDAAESKGGTFTFSCGLDQSAFAEEGGEYTLKFTTNENVENPTIHLNPTDVKTTGVTVNKAAGTFNDDDKTITYTITVKNTGEAVAQDVVVTDVMGQYLSYDSLISGNGVTVDGNGNTKTFTISSLAVGESKTITYRCKVSDEAFFSANAASGSSYGLANTISATVDGDKTYIDSNKKTEQSVGFNINKDIVSKSNSVSADGEKITWTIRINAGSDTFDLGGCTFTDTMDAGLTLDPSTVEVTCVGGTQTVMDALATAIKNGTSYQFPDGTKGEYIIEYTTNVADHAGLKTYTNTAKVTDGVYTDTAPSTTEPIGEVISSKEYAGDDPNAVGFMPDTNSENNVIIPWEVTIDVPDDATSFSFYDTVYSWENGLGYVGSGSDIFTMTVDGNSFTDFNVTSDTANPQMPKHTITITDANMASVRGKKVVISYKTIGKYADVSDGQSIYYQNHYGINLGNYNETGTGNVTYKKTATSDDFIKKGVSSNNNDGTVTWSIEVSANDTNSLKNLVLTDVITDMEYAGCEGYTDTLNPMVYITDKSYQTYRLPIVIAETGASTEEHPQYQFTIDFSQPLTNVSVWDGNVDLASGQPITQNIVITYKTKIAGEYSEYNNEHTYTNDVTATANIGTGNTTSTSESSASTTVKNEVISKSSTQDSKKGTNVLTYTLNINKAGVKLNPDANEHYFLVEDVLPSTQILKPSSVVITNKDTGMPLSQASTADEVKNSTAGNLYYLTYVDNVINIVVPDEVKLSIVYDVTILSDASQGYVTYVNSAKLEEPYVSKESQVSDSTSRQVYTSNVNLYSYTTFVVEKIDALNITKTLPGAKFRFTEYEENSTKNGWVPSGKVYIGTTNDAGIIDAYNDLVLENTETKASISANKIYEVEEINPPYGYEKTDKVYKLIVVNSNADDAPTAAIPSDVFRITSGTTITFSNMPLAEQPANKLVIEKQYYEADGRTLAAEAPTTNAQIQVFKGTYDLAACKSGKYTPLATGDLGNGFTYSNEDNVITLERIPEGEYTVYERSAPAGYDILTKVYHFRVVDNLIYWEDATTGVLGIEDIVIKNKKTYNNSLTIDKKYVGYGGEEIDAANVPEKAVFTYQQTHYMDENGNLQPQTGEVKEIPTTDGFTYTLNKLPAGTYVINEKTSSIYKNSGMLPLIVNIDGNGEITLKDSTGVVGTANVNRTYSVDNIVQDNSLVVSKTYYLADGTKIRNNEIPVSLPADDGVDNRQKVIFDLYVLDGADYVLATGECYEDAYTTFAQTDSEVDKYFWENLEPGSYMLKEKLVESPVKDETQYEALQTIFFTVNNEYKIDVPGSKAPSYDASVDVENRLSNGTTGFYLKKHLSNQAGNSLPEIEDADASSIIFTITYPDGAVNTLDYDIEKNRYYVENLTVGTYTITEECNKPGYNPGEAIQITVATKDANSSDVEITDIKYGNSPITSSMKNTIWTEVQIEDGVEILVTHLVNAPKENAITIEKSYLQPSGAVYPDYNKKAVFELYDDTDTLIKRIAVPTDDKYIFSNLEIGFYYIREVAPDGFTGCGDIHFTVNADYTITIADQTSNAQVTVGNNNLHKVDAEVTNKLSNKFVLEKSYKLFDGTVVTNLAAYSQYFTLTSFEVYNDEACTQLSSVGVSKDSGTGTFTIENIDDGTYYIKETAPTGFETAGLIKLVVESGNITATYMGSNKVDYTVEDNSTASVSASLINNQKSNSISVIKQYYKANGTTTVDINDVPVKASFKLVDAATGNEVTYVLKTNQAYKGEYTFKNIAPGNYKIVEATILGYETVADMTFTVDAFGNIDLDNVAEWTVTSDGTLVASATALNKQKSNKLALGKIFVNEEGTNSTTDVGTVNFKLVSDDGSTEIPLNRVLISQTYTATDIPTGTYKLVEETPDGFKPLDGEITVVVDVDRTVSVSYSGTASDCIVTNDGTHEDIFVALYNHEISNSVVINKEYYSFTGVKLDPSKIAANERATFDLYKDYGKSTVKHITETDKIAVDNEKGTFTFKNLEEGSYTIVETVGSGYLTTGVENISFVVNSDRTITMDGATGTVFDKKITVKNTRKQFSNSIRISKSFVDKQDNAVSAEDYTNYMAQVSFGLYTSDGIKIDDFTYSTYGYWEIKNLDPLDGAATYIIRETSCPSGFIRMKDLEVRVAKTGATTCAVVPTIGDRTDVTYNVTGNTGNSEIVINITNHEGDVIKISKQDITNSNELTGAKLQITKANSMEKIEWTSTDVPYEILLNDLEPNVEYTLTEIIAPEGYYKAESINFMIDANGDVLTKNVSDTAYTQGTDTVVMYDEPTSVMISKQDISGAELSGATLVVKDNAGKTYDIWTSGSTPHEIKGLAIGKAYTLYETAAPNGYAYATEITFKLNEDKTVSIYNEETKRWEQKTDSTVTMVDEVIEVNISKEDISGNELEGAKLTLTDSRGTKVDEWISGTTSHTVTGLVAGEIYTLHETAAPDGYAYATDIKFKVNNDGTVSIYNEDTSKWEPRTDSEVVMVDQITKVYISKQDVSGEELEGATLTLTDSQGTEIDEWVSGSTKHVIEGLVVGEEYTLHETAAPEGYEYATDIKFKLNEDGTISIYNEETAKWESRDDSTVVMVDEAKTSSVNISKQNVSGEELEGATLTITDSQGAKVEEWVSGTTEHTVDGLKIGEEYTLHEIAAPDGYGYATDIKFKLNEDGTVSIYNEETGKWESREDSTVVMVDEITTVYISKQDVSGEELEGATLTITDSQGTKVEEWVSGTSKHIIEGLVIGEEYTLHETAAPEGYEYATDIKFKLNEDETISVYNEETGEWEQRTDSTVVMVDEAKTPEEDEPETPTTTSTETNTEITTSTDTGINTDTDKVPGAPSTGDKAPLAMLVVIMLISALGFVILGSRRKKY